MTKPFDIRNDPRRLRRAMRRLEQTLARQGKQPLAPWNLEASRRRIRKKDFLTYRGKND